MKKMSLCERIEDICENKRVTIFDTNFFINFLNFITRDRKRSYREVFTEFRDFLTLLFECADHEIHCSQRVYDEEYKKTISIKVPYLKRLSGEYQRNFTNLIEGILNLKVINNDIINKIEELSNNFLEQKGINRVVERNDLSLLLIALEILKRKKTTNSSLFVTDDTSLYSFINHINQQNHIELDGVVFKNLSIIPITCLSYMTTAFKCCKFEKLGELGKFFFEKRMKIENPKMREIKLKPFYNWWTIDYYKARSEKEQKIEG